jgi:hypothetical protein
MGDEQVSTERRSSRSQRALKALIDDAARTDAIRVAVIAAFGRQQIHGWKTGSTTPMADTAGKLHTITEGKVPADGWVPDGGGAS